VPLTRQWRWVACGWLVGRSVGWSIRPTYESAEENARRAHVRLTIPHGGHLTLYRRCPTKGAFSHARKRPRRGRDIPLSRILPYLTRNGPARCGFSGWIATVIRHFASDITPRFSPSPIPMDSRARDVHGREIPRRDEPSYPPSPPPPLHPPPSPDASTSVARFTRARKTIKLAREDGAIKYTSAHVASRASPSLSLSLSLSLSHRAICGLSDPRKRFITRVKFAFIALEPSTASGKVA